MYSETDGEELAIQARLQSDHPDKKTISVTQFLPKTIVKAMIAKILSGSNNSSSGFSRSNHPDIQVNVIISSDFARECVTEFIKNDPNLSLSTNATIGATDLDHFLMEGSGYGDVLINVRSSRFSLLI